MLFTEPIELNTAKQHSALILTLFTVSAGIHLLQVCSGSYLSFRVILGRIGIYFPENYEVADTASACSCTTCFSSSICLHPIHHSIHIKGSKHFTYLISSINWEISLCINEQVELHKKHLQDKAPCLP